jgi:rod shape determining protein RodA
MEKQSSHDPWLLVPVTVLLVFGLMAIYSATNGTGDTTLFYRQLAWACFGLVALVFVSYNDVRFVKDNAYIFYAVGVLLLVAVLIFGKKIAGQTSWMKIGWFSFHKMSILVKNYPSI